MIWRSFALCTLLVTPAWADISVKLTDVNCPYSANDLPPDTTAACSTMAWQDASIDFRTTVAVLKPGNARTDAAPIVYIPGGPGDAPVNKGGNVASILSLFPGRALITLNPRGVKGATPRPTCEFAEDFWDEDHSVERETEIVTDCRDSVTFDLARFDAPHLAQDVSRMIEALGIKRAGVFAISYGTESALHLLADKAPWMDMAILDSVSLPGVIGSFERLEARDRFLGVIDRLCFAEKQCASSVTSQYENLLDWTAQFDDEPLDLKLGPHKKEWSLDSKDMLGFVASLASYPDGAGYGPLLIEAFEASRKSTAVWIKSELENGFKYASENFALLYAAFSDSDERNLPTPKAGDTHYPFKIDDQEAFARLFRVWNKDNRTEARFIGADTRKEPAHVPVLVLSGGADTLTPLEWATELDRRFSSLTRFVFPHLGHAVAFGKDADVKDKEVAMQLNCGPKVVRAFASGKSYNECERYMRKALDD